MISPRDCAVLVLLSPWGRFNNSTHHPTVHDCKSQASAAGQKEVATLWGETPMGSCNGNGTVGLIEAPRSGHAGLIVTRVKESSWEAKRLLCEKEAR